MRQKFFSRILILLGLIISLKAFYILYLLVLIPVFLKFKKRNFLDLFRNFYFYIFGSLGFFLVLVNIFNSGCIIYPVGISCFSNLEWSLSSTKLSYQTIGLNNGLKLVQVQIIELIIQKIISKVLIGFQIGLTCIFLIK